MDSPSFLSTKLCSSLGQQSKIQLSEYKKDGKGWHFFFSKCFVSCFIHFPSLWSSTVHSWQKKQVLWLLFVPLNEQSKWFKYEIWFIIAINYKSIIWFKYEIYELGIIWMSHVNIMNCECTAVWVFFLTVYQSLNWARKPCHHRVTTRVTKSCNQGQQDIYVAELNENGKYHFCPLPLMSWKPAKAYCI
jgi:hypothetical protein